MKVCVTRMKGERDREGVGGQQYATVTRLTVPCSLRAEWEEEEKKRGGEKMEPFWR